MDRSDVSRVREVEACRFGTCMRWMGVRGLTGSVISCATHRVLVSCEQSKRRDRVW